MRVKILSPLFSRTIILLWMLLFVPALYAAMLDEADAPFNDAPLTEQLRYPAWFRLSFLNLREDFDDAITFNKRGLIVYLGQRFCPYCQALLERNFGKSDIERYTRRYFDVVAVDIHGDNLLTDMAGVEMSEQAFAEQQQATFTPTLLFYASNGKEVLRLRGYYPPYKFRAALEYVADGYYREESFRDYLERADPPLAFEPGGLNEEDFFSPPPCALDRSRIPASAPLAVFFEQGDCHACDVLHTAPLNTPEIRQLLGGFESVQLNIWADTPVITPAGERTTSRAWAEKLGLFYTPTIIFFDEHGQEILRVDSVVGFYRLRSVLEYVLSGAYKRGISLQRFRRVGGEGM